MTTTATSDTTQTKVQGFDLFAAVAAIDLTTREKWTDGGKVEEGERVVGKINDDLRRLHYVCQDLSGAVDPFWKEAQALAKAHEAEHERGSAHDCFIHLEKQAEIEKRAQTALRRHHVTNDIFWNQVRLMFPESYGNNVGLREDYQVVVMKP